VYGGLTVLLVVLRNHLSQLAGCCDLSSSCRARLRLAGFVYSFFFCHFFLRIGIPSRKGLYSSSLTMSHFFGNVVPRRSASLSYLEVGRVVSSRSPAVSLSIFDNCAYGITTLGPVAYRLVSPNLLYLRPVVIMGVLGLLSLLPAPPSSVVCQLSLSRWVVSVSLWRRRFFFFFFFFCFLCASVCKPPPAVDHLMLVHFFVIPFRGVLVTGSPRCRSCFPWTYSTANSRLLYF